MGKLTYHQGLSILELVSLELRLVRADLIDASLNYFFVPRFNEFRRGHDYKLYLPTCKSNIRSNSFNYRVIHKWNLLPSNTDFTSLKIFHKSLTPEVLLPYCKVFLQRGRIACNAERCISHGNFVPLSVCLSVCLSVRHTLVPYPGE